MPAEEMLELSGKLAAHKEAIDRYFWHHVDC
jgi:hypothetical protein